MPIGPPEGFLDITNATLRTSVVGISNTGPTGELSVGSNLHVNTTASNVLQVVGNVSVHNMTLGEIRMLPAYGLENVTEVGNTTPFTVSFSNATTGLATTSNLHVGGTLKIGTVEFENPLSLAAVSLVSNTTPYTIEFSNATTGLVTTSNVVVGGHILPSGNELSDLGAPDNKFRDLYISDNSLWVGDTTKIAFSGGKMRFRKRKTNIVPAVVTNAGGNQSAALAHAGKAALTDMKLVDWRNYGKSLNASLEVSDIFTDTDADYEVDEVVNTVYPVGSIYLSVNGTNPGSLPSFAGTTWVAYGEGRTMIGHGAGAGLTNRPTVEATGGAETHTLTTDEMPSHTHTSIDNNAGNVGGYRHHWSDGGHTEVYHTDVYRDTTSTGGGQAHNNMQPYIVTYMWKRTA